MAAALAVLQGLLGPAGKAWADAADDAGRTMLHDCAARGLLEPAAMLLQAGAHVDSLTGGLEGGQTPLHYALFGWFEGQADMVRNSGTEVESRSKHFCDDDT